MKKSLAVVLLLLAGCSTGPAPENADDGIACGGTFDGGEDDGEAEPDSPEETVVLERSDVQHFRGTEMVKLLEKMDSRDQDDWKYVRRHVHPAPLPPVEYHDDGSLKRRNFDWPPDNAEKLDDRQKAWMSYLLWPRHVRRLLHEGEVVKDGRATVVAWDSAENRSRLAAYGRMYARLHEFQTRQPFSSPTRESEYWREFAESMLAWGDDGRELLTANMIVALSNPDEDVVYIAQDIIVQIGEPAIEPLCAAMWTSHRQLIAGWEERIDETTGKRIREDVYVPMGNPNYNEYIMDTLYRIGPRVAGYAISELEYSVDADGKSIGMAWRFRRYFIELLGKLGPVLDSRMRGDALRAIESEISRVVVEEYDAAELAKGKRVIDKVATDDATFFFHEYLIQALGELGAIEGMRPIIKLWKLDDFHELAAIGALGKITKKSIRSLDDAREAAKKLKVDLKGE